MVRRLDACVEGLLLAFLGCVDLILGTVLGWMSVVSGGEEIKN
jgi:hypothetical protein